MFVQLHKREQIMLQHSELQEFPHKRVIIPIISGSRGYISNRTVYRLTETAVCSVNGGEF